MKILKDQSAQTTAICHEYQTLFLQKYINFSKRVTFRFLPNLRWFNKITIRETERVKEIWLCRIKFGQVVDLQQQKVYRGVFTVVEIRNLGFEVNEVLGIVLLK